MAQESGIDRAQVHWRPKRSRVSSLFLEHTLQVNDVRIAVQLATTKHGLDLVQWIGEGELKAMCAWIKKNLGPGVPVHFTRFHPTYKIRNLPRTPVSTLERAYRTAKSEGLHFPYVGNVPGHDYESTYCPGCGGKLIDRTGYVVTGVKIKGDSCPSCGVKIPGVWTRKDVKWL